MIKVLWIDDNPTEFEEFRDDAFDEGIDIDVFTTVDAGLKALEDKTQIYDAIILDANCKISDEAFEAPQLIALSHAIVGLYVRNINLPWFVYTGGGYEGAEALEHIIPQQYRIWDAEKQWYDKPDDEFALFDAIKRSVASMEQFKIKLKYPEVFKICHTDEVMKLLQRVNDEDFDRDEHVPNSIRCIADEICDYLCYHGIYPDVINASNKVGSVAYMVKGDTNCKTVPLYIQDTLAFLNNYTNSGSHNKAQKHAAKLNKYREDIMSGNAPHLNRTAVHALLTFFSWASSFPIDDHEKMGEYVSIFSKIKASSDSYQQNKSKKSDSNNG